VDDRHKGGQDSRWDLNKSIKNVMAGLVPAIHDFSVKRLFKTNTSVCQPKGISRGQAPS
jgi:hypothetical protein